VTATGFLNYRIISNLRVVFCMGILGETLRKRQSGMGSMVPGQAGKAGGSNWADLCNNRMCGKATHPGRGPGFDPKKEER
jgi:hypothetical protein